MSPARAEEAIRIAMEAGAYKAASRVAYQAARDILGQIRFVANRKRDGASFVAEARRQRAAARRLRRWAAEDREYARALLLGDAAE